jgi:hypothetical protein
MKLTRTITHFQSVHTRDQILKSRLGVGQITGLINACVRGFKGWKCIATGVAQEMASRVATHEGTPAGM